MRFKWEYTLLQWEKIWTLKNIYWNYHYNHQAKSTSSRVSTAKKTLFKFILHESLVLNERTNSYSIVYKWKNTEISVFAVNDVRREFTIVFKKISSIPFSLSSESRLNHATSQLSVVRKSESSLIFQGLSTTSSFLSLTNIEFQENIIAKVENNKKKKQKRENVEMNVKDLSQKGRRQQEEECFVESPKFYEILVKKIWDGTFFWNFCTFTSTRQVSITLTNFAWMNVNFTTLYNHNNRKKN